MANGNNRDYDERIFENVGSLQVKLKSHSENGKTEHTQTREVSILRG